MAQALRDQNHVPVGIGVSNTDSVTPVMLRVDPVTGYLIVDNTSQSLAVTSAETDKRDQNHVPTVYGVSSVDGVTPVPIRTDEDGKLLVQFD